MAVTRYTVNTFNWGVVQSAGTAPTALTLAVTGSGNWTAVGVNESSRLGSLAFQSADDLVHAFAVRAEYTILVSNYLRFRLYDVTNSLAIASVVFDGDYPMRSTETFANLPAGDGRVQLQYTLISPAAADFYAAVWETNRWGT